MTDLGGAFRDFRINASRWRFSDVRINIPELSFGSDAINPHTQYSNAVAFVDADGDVGAGACFTLGSGNELVCQAAATVVSKLDGLVLGDVMDAPGQLYDLLANPRQIRWLSPFAGLPYMASGLILNTVIDLVAKRLNMPAWEFLARLPSSDWLALAGTRHWSSRSVVDRFRVCLDAGLAAIDERIELLRRATLPAYFTTWIGHATDDILHLISDEMSIRGHNTFKFKIGPDLAQDHKRISRLIEGLPPGARFAVDANQSMSLDQAVEWSSFLVDHGALWLEEPFAPDNIEAFARLSQMGNVPVATGENCPNPHTALALCHAGIARFQPDPCRMLGITDAIVSGVLALNEGVLVTPHAGGAGLDELSPHIQLALLARFGQALDPSETLTENIGFCSKYYSSPTRVVKGRILPPLEPGLLVGFTESVERNLRPAEEGISWLEL